MYVGGKSGCKSGCKLGCSWVVSRDGSRGVSWV